MRNLLILFMLVIAAFAAGWFSIDRGNEETTIKINKNEIRSDAQRAIERGREYLNRENIGTQTGDGQTGGLQFDYQTNATGQQPTAPFSPPASGQNTTPGYPSYPLQYGSPESYGAPTETPQVPRQASGYPQSYAPTGTPRY